MDVYELSELFWRLSEAFTDHWPLVLMWLFFVAVPLIIQSVLLRRAWRSHHHDGTIHISQNTFEMRTTGKDGAEEPWLVLDVHDELPLETVLHHPIAQKLVRSAAKKTNEYQPFVIIPPDDRWHVLNMVRNKIAAPFHIGTARKMTKAGAKTEVVPCVFALTYERYPGMRHGKIRAVLISRELLTGSLLDRAIRVEDESHRDRISTLRMMREDYAKGSKAEFCMDVRLNVPV